MAFLDNLFAGTDPAADARKRLDAAEQIAGRCRNELRERRRRLSEAVDANRVDLDAEDLAEQVDGAGTEATRIAAQIEAVEDACRRADRRVVDARRDVLTAHADRLETEAADLRKKADRHQGKVDKLLAKLEELDGATYVPWSPMVEGMSPQEYALMYGPESLSRWTRPKAKRLNAEADEAEARARKIRQRAATVDLTDAAAFEAAVAAANPDSPEAQARRDRTQAAKEHADAVRQAWKDGRQAVYDSAYAEAREAGKSEVSADTVAKRTLRRVPLEPVANPARTSRTIADLDPDEISRAFEQADDPGDVFEILHGPRPSARKLRRARAG